MSGKRPGRSLEFLRGSRSVFRQKLQSANNLDWLLTLAVWGFRDRWLKILPPISPRFGSVDGPVRGVGLALSRAVIERLRRQFPAEADRDDATLVRYYPDQTAAILNQTLGHLDDVLSRDLMQRPGDPLESRVPRVLPKLMALPSRTGRSAESDLSKLRYLAAYEAAFEKLSYRRGTGRGTDYLPEDIEKVFGPPGSKEKRLLSMTRQQLALEYASRTVEPKLTARRVRDLLPTLKRLARAMDLAGKDPGRQ